MFWLRLTVESIRVELSRVYLSVKVEYKMYSGGCRSVEVEVLVTGQALECGGAELMDREAPDRQLTVTPSRGTEAAGVHRAAAVAVAALDELLHAQYIHAFLFRVLPTLMLSNVLAFNNAQEKP